MRRFVVGLISILLLAAGAEATWLPKGVAPYELVDNVESYTVKANGLSVSEREVTFRVLNDQGRTEMALQTLPFHPEASKIEVLSAYSVTGGVENRVDLGSLKTRDSAAAGKGLSSLKEVVIPFSNLKVGSLVKYKYRDTALKSHVPGLFSQIFVYGVHFPENNSLSVIRSEIPIYFKAHDPDKALQITRSREGALYVLKIHQSVPVFKVPTEENPSYHNELFTKVEVSTMNSWEGFVTPVAKNYEALLKGQILSASLQRIVNQAKSKKNIPEKIDTVTSELASVMTYSGDWSTFDRMYFPRSVGQIDKLKTGDCKDFSVLTALMLRKLGVQADVAFVSRKNYKEPIQELVAEPLDPQMPMLGRFNHAIVKVQAGDKVYWIDPTNTVSDARAPFDDIAGSWALVVKSGVKALERIPEVVAENSQLSYEKTLNVKDDKTAESATTGQMTGAYSKVILEISHTQGEGTAQKVLAAITGVDSKSAKIFSEKTNFKSRLADKMFFSQKSFGEQIVFDKDGKKYLGVALPSRLRTFAGINPERETHFPMGTPGIERSRIKIPHYDFVGYQQGCTILTPWYQLERRFFKTEDGFEVQDTLVMRSEEVTPKEIKADKFGMSVSDIGECANTQAVEIRELKKTDTLAERLKDYSLIKAKDYNDIRGPHSVEGARIALHITEHLLRVNGKDKNAKVQMARAYRMVGYKNNSVDRKEYLDRADGVLDELVKEFPQDPAILQQRAYSALQRKDAKLMAQRFSLAYSLSPKDFELYVLGGDIASEMKKYDAAVGSYSKALAMAATPTQKSRAGAGMGWALVEKGEQEDGLRFLKDAAAADPKDTWIQGNLVNLLNRLQHWDESIALGEALNQSNSDSLGRKALATAYGGKSNQMLANTNKHRTPGFYAQAEGLVMKGLKWDSENEECLEAIGVIYFEQAMTEKNMDKAQKSLEYSERLQKISGGHSAGASMRLTLLNNLVKSLEAGANNRMPASSK